MTRFLASQLATSHWFDISAARRDFGYEPRVSTAEGMRRLGEWLREQQLSRKRLVAARASTSRLARLRRPHYNRRITLDHVDG